MKKIFAIKTLTFKIDNNFKAFKLESIFLPERTQKDNK